jgi:hypothetical protein
MYLRWNLQGLNVDGEAARAAAQGHVAGHRHRVQDQASNGRGAHAKHAADSMYAMQLRLLEFKNESARAIIQSRQGGIAHKPACAACMLARANASE